MESLVQPGVGDVVQFKDFDRSSVIVGISEQIVHAALIIESGEPGRDVLSLPGTHFKNEIDRYVEHWSLDRVVNGMMNHIRHALTESAQNDIRQKMIEELTRQQMQ